MGIPLSPLAEYLLAWTDEAGNPICRWANPQYTIPILPPGTTVEFDILPVGNNYCSIIVWNRWSPSINPGTIFFDTRHKGVIFQSGVLGTMALAESHNLWVEVTRKDYVHTTVQNVSPVNQYFQAMDVHLVIQVEDHLEKVHELINSYGGAGVLAELRKTNELLTQLANRQ